MERDHESRWRVLLGRLESPGLSPRQERAMNAGLLLVALVLLGGWTAAIAWAAAGGERLQVASELTANPFSPSAPPPAAYLLDRLARTAVAEVGWRGRSGALRAIITQPGDSLVLADTLGLDSLPAGVSLEIQQADSPGVSTAAEDVGAEPGVWNVLLRAGAGVRRLTDLTLLTPVPTEVMREGRIGRYLIGEWPTTGRTGKHAGSAYDPPSGLVEVTPENRDLPVSEHFVLGDFLTKGQEDVWPKYVAISPRVLDKLELTFQELERRGHPVENVGVISAFRTPHYNAAGGDPSGRGSLSRHMYGDAVDFYIDNDGDGAMDDLNGDGRIDRGDGRVVAQAAARVEEQYPEYVGGIGVYRPNPGAHSGFVHVDTRGYRARW